MPDYYAILWRTLKTGDYESPQWRNSVFDRCWWIKCARGGRRFQIARSVQTDVLDAAIKTISIGICAQRQRRWNGVRSPI